MNRYPGSMPLKPMTWPQKISSVDGEVLASSTMIASNCSVWVSADATSAKSHHLHTPNTCDYEMPPFVPS